MKENIQNKSSLYNNFNDIEKKEPSFLIYDYETFGQHPALDRPAQFASIRTDINFNIIEQPLVIYCIPADDYLPQPEAVMITGITPQHARIHGVNEAEFSRQIYQAFSTANTCILGYNNIRFDDEFSRNIFYRNFYDPYAYSWQNGNSRWDLLDVTRACYALRPEGITWPKNSKNLPSFKLEHLTKANGIVHQNAHDAMADVYATLALAKIIKQAQPRLFNYFYQHRGKNKLDSLINIAEMTPLVHVSGMFGASRNNISLVAPLAWHPENRNAVIMCDLVKDISPLLELDIDQLQHRLYTPHTQLTIDQSPVPIKLVHINKSPILAPANTMSPQLAKSLSIDRQFCLMNLQFLRKNPHIRKKIVDLFAQPFLSPKSNNVDVKLYDGFFNHNDRAIIQMIQQTAPQNLSSLNLSFQDPRLEPLLFRFRARNYAHTLDEMEHQYWLKHRQERLSPEKMQEYFLQLQHLCYQYKHDEKKLAMLKALSEYATELIKTL